MKYCDNFLSIIFLIFYAVTGRLFTEIFTGDKLTEVNNGFIVTENVRTKKTREIPCEKVVLALGSKSENKLAKELSAAGFDVTAIGDAKKVGKIADATKAAYLTATSIE